MNKFVTENLILLDFLVDEIVPTEDTNKKMNLMKGETNVIFQFLDNEPIVLTKDDLKPRCGDEPLRNGKSFLFSMSPQQGIMALGNFVINLKLIKKFKPGTLPDFVNIGDGELFINELFQDLMDCAMSSNEKAWVKCLKDTVKLYCGSTWVGCLTCVVRMSCFGKYIVRPCQMHMGDFLQHNLVSTTTTACIPLNPSTTSNTSESIKSIKSNSRINNTEETMQLQPTSRGDGCDNCGRTVPLDDHSDMYNNSFTYFVNQSNMIAASKSLKDPITEMHKPQLVPCAPCPVCTPVSSARPSEASPTRTLRKESSKEKVVLHLKSGKRYKDQPIQLEIQTPKVSRRRKLKQECREQQYEYKDFPRNYLIDYYGREKLYDILMEQVAHEEEIETKYGKCPVGELANGKRGKGGIKTLLFQLVGAAELLKKQEEEVETLDSGPLVKQKVKKLKNKRKSKEKSAGLVFMDKRSDYPAYLACMPTCPVVKSICNA